MEQARRPNLARERLRDRAEHFAWAALVGLLALAASGLFAGGVRADPIVVSQATPLAGGLVAHDVSIDFRDGRARSGFVQITFTGSFDPQSTLLGANWPDLQQLDPGGTSSSVYSLRGGTGGGSRVDVVGVARLVLPEGESFAFDAVISRDGRSFTVVPEPEPALLSASGAVTLFALSRWGPARCARRRRP